MSPFEISILRFIFTLDNILVGLMPWFKALTIAAVAVLVALLTRSMIRRRACSIRRVKGHTVTNNTIFSEENRI